MVPESPEHTKPPPETISAVGTGITLISTVIVSLQSKLSEPII